MVLLAALASVTAALFVISCGGGGGTITPPPPTPTATLAPSSLAFGNQNVDTQSAAQTVTLANSGNAALSISGITLTGTNASDFSQSNVCGASLAAGKSCNIVVMFQPTAQGARTASLSVADNAAGSPQAATLTGTGVIPPDSISPSSALVLLGGTQSFALTAQNTCASALFGNVPVSGSGTTYTAAYTAPQALPSAWADTLTCTATVGGAKVSAQVTLNYPVPTITGTSAPYGSLGTLFLFGPAAGSFFVNGSGFLSDGSFNPLNDQPDTCGVSLVSWSEVQVNFAIGYNDFGFQCSQGGAQSVWDPGFLNFTASDPATGHGGGTSNIGRLGFLGDQNLVAFNKTDAFLLDPATSTVRKFKIADGSPDGSFTFTPGTGLAIAVDDVTGYLVLFTGTSTEAFDPVTNTKVMEIDTSPGALHGGAAGGDWAVLTAGGTLDYLDAINLTQGSVIHESVANTPQDAPWDYQLTNLGGNLVAVVWSVNTGVLSAIAIPSFNVINSIALPNIFDFTIMGSMTAQTEKKAPDGWQLLVFNSGPLQGTAVLISQYDQVLVYVNLTTMTEIRRVDLTAPFKNANPPLPVLQSFRIGKDEADGSVVVAFADPVNGKTALYTVDANGNMAPLTATEPWLATGLQESADGTQIYWGNRSSFAIAPKQ